jgi:hypothetical protein
MKIGDEIFFMPAVGSVKGAKTLTVEHVGVKHFMCSPYTFRMTPDGPMLGTHSAGSAWESKDAYARYRRSRDAWNKIRRWTSGVNPPIPANVTLEDLEKVIELLKVK